MYKDFIKWMCEKAEGFRIEQSTWDSTNWYLIYNRGEGRDNCPLEKISLQKSALYPLLLQRAIEGVNREKTDYEIEQFSDFIEICEAEYGLERVSFDSDSIDTAKESALKYIYEKERENG